MIDTSRIASGFDVALQDAAALVVMGYQLIHPRGARA
jgi:hypothetical protein